MCCIGELYQYRHLEATWRLLCLRSASQNAGKLTIPLALLVALLLVLGVDVLGLRDPVQVALQVLFKLLLLAELLEIATSLGLLTLFGELSARDGQERDDETCIAFLQQGRFTHVMYYRGQVWRTYPLNTPSTRLRTKKDPKMTRLTK